MRIGKHLAYIMYHHIYGKHLETQNKYVYNTSLMSSSLRQVSSKHSGDYAGPVHPALAALPVNITDFMLLQIPAMNPKMVMILLLINHSNVHNNPMLLTLTCCYIKTNRGLPLKWTTCRGVLFQYRHSFLG